MVEARLRQVQHSSQYHRTRMGSTRFRSDKTPTRTSSRRCWPGTLGSTFGTDHLAYIPVRIACSGPFLIVKSFVFPLHCLFGLPLSFQTSTVFSDSHSLFRLSQSFQTPTVFSDSNRLFRLSVFSGPHSLFRLPLSFQTPIVFFRLPLSFQIRTVFSYPHCRF